MSIHPVDRHVGERIRARRKEIGISQQALAEKLGLTFQQVQKYERGMNRVSASKLYETAQVLSVSIEWFFLGLDTPELMPAQRLIPDPMAGLDRDQRKAVENLIKTLAKSN